jgi:hypothetical protein
VRNHLAVLERFEGFQPSTITGIARDFMEAERGNSPARGHEPSNVRRSPIRAEGVGEAIRPVG